MNIQTIVTVLAALAAGVLGAVVVGSGDAPPPATDEAALIELRDEVADLARTHRRLLDRIEVLESRPAVVAAPAEPRGAAAETVREVEPAAAPAQAAASAERPEALKEQVTEALEEIRAEEDRRRDEERAERRREQREAELARLAEELGLNAYQSNLLRDVMTEQREKMATAFEELRESRDWEGMRAARDEVREEMNVTLGTFLTQEQIDKLNESTRNFRAFGGRGGRGDRGF